MVLIPAPLAPDTVLTTRHLVRDSRPDLNRTDRPVAILEPPPPAATKSAEPQEGKGNQEQEHRMPPGEEEKNANEDKRHRESTSPGRHGRARLNRWQLPQDRPQLARRLRRHGLADPFLELLEGQPAIGGMALQLVDD